ncbi:hypothetical protein BRARA_I02927 [Brassica rapa]|uniref:Uncharacterized protein n=1 Tax=Brassica campestris TaxID=3711 RepID=A0A397XZ47_BRACM|nr:hypothetical protein BRARA_I02927 [Brassica rapa]
MKNQFFFQNLNIRTRSELTESELKIPEPDQNSNTFEHLTTHSFSYLGYILLRLVFQATIYMVWREKNDRRHFKKPRQHHQLAKIIDKTVRNRLLATRYWEKQRLRDLMQEWYKTHT